MKKLFAGAALCSLVIGVAGISTGDPKPYNRDDLGVNEVLVREVKEFHSPLYTTIHCNEPDNPQTKTFLGGLEKAYQKLPDYFTKNCVKAIKEGPIKIAYNGK